jgi:hypothetical protein
MNYELKIGIRTKWLAISIGLILLGWLMGSIGGWREASFLNIFAPFIILFGTAIGIVLVINTMVYDFSDKSEKKKSW